MDSKDYKYLISDIISNRTIKLSELLPIQFVSENIVPDDKNGFESVAYFLEKIVLCSDPNKPQSISLPSILTIPGTNFFSTLFKTAHQKLLEFFLGKTDQPETPPFKRNGTELLRFLCHAASTKWIPIFPDSDIVNLAMCLFLSEALMNAGWCPNAFEDVAKRTAHTYFTALKKSLYKANDSELSAILGYVQSAWICARKTEGIQDKIPEWEKNDYISLYSWELTNEDNSINKINCTMYQYPENSLFFILPRYNSRIPHPFSNLHNENRAGLTLSYKDEPVIAKKIVDYKPTQRQKTKGEQITYACALSNRQILWKVVIQVFKSTIYRLDLLQPVNGTCTISNAELRIENSIPVLKTTENKYLGKSHSNIAIEFLKDPFFFEFYNQEERDISLFKGKEAAFSHDNPLELITAWSCGKNITSIDRTNLLGIFEFPE